jgi:AraC-like DNA-binding protein
MIEGYREWSPEAGNTLQPFVHRMAYGYFPMPLPPEQLAPDSYVKWALILDGEPQYFDRNGRMDWHDGFCGHVPPERGIIATSEGPVRCVMVNFYPSGFHRLTGKDIETFNGRMVRPQLVIGDAIDGIYGAMREGREPEVMFAELRRYIESLIPNHTPKGPSPIMDLERRIREAKGMLQITDLATSAGLSDRQLQRRFKREVGLPPKEFSSVVRFNHVYSHMQRTRKLDLDIALQCGYFDESHMLRDLRYYLGEAPKRFAGLIRPMVDTSLGH